MIAAWGVAVIMGMYGLVSYQMTPAVLEHPYFSYSARSALVRLRPVPSVGTVCWLPTGGMDAIAVVSRFA